jgi:hypothetical protein
MVRWDDGDVTSATSGGRGRSGGAIKEHHHGGANRRMEACVEEEGINLVEEEGIVSRVRGSKILAREDSTSCCPKPLQEITVIMSFNSI